MYRYQAQSGIIVFYGLTLKLDVKTTGCNFIGHVKLDVEKFSATVKYVLKHKIRPTGRQIPGLFPCIFLAVAYSMGFLFTLINANLIFRIRINIFPYLQAGTLFDED